DGGDVVRIPGERRPAEGSHAEAEQRPDVGRDEARVRERVLYPGFLPLTPKVVAVVEDVAAELDVREHALDVPGDRLAPPPARRRSSSGSLSRSFAAASTSSPDGT